MSQKRTATLGVIGVGLLQMAAAGQNPTALPPSTPSSGWATIGQVATGQATIDVPAVAKTPAEATAEFLSSDAMRNVTGIIQVVTSLFNLALVIWFFKKNAEIRDRERREDSDERSAKLKLETMSFWIQKLTMEPATKLLHEFFDAWEPTGKTETETPAAAKRSARTKVEEFKKKLREVRSRVEEPLILVSAEFAAIGPILNDLEDVVTGDIQTRFLGIEPAESRERPADAYRRLRKKFFSSIYETHRNVTDL